MKSTIVVVLLLLTPSQAIDVSVTINIAAGTIECLHQSLVKGVEYEVEYQVIDGGDLDVNFHVTTPSRQTFLTDFRKTGDIHKRTASETGDYRFCIDNTFSHFSNKIVYFELYTNEDSDDDDEADRLFSALPDLQDYEIKLDDLKEVLDRIKDRLHKSTQVQKMFSVAESRDRSVLEHNFERVNFWSAVQLVVMVTAGVVNVVLIRWLFTDHSRTAKFVKQRT